MNTSFNNYATGVLDVLPENVKQALLQAGTRIKHGDGQLVQSRGSDSSGIMIVLNGNIRMMTIGEDGSALLSAILGPGQQINEVTMFAGAVQTHDVITVGDTELLCLTPAEYERFAAQYPEIVHALMVSNVHRVHQLIELLNDLRALPKSVVVARLLYKNARHERSDSTVNAVDLDISQEDIAMFLGISRAYLNKVLAQLGELGLVQVSYRKVHVLDIEALATWIQDHLTYDPVEEIE